MVYQIQQVELYRSTSPTKWRTVMAYQSRASDACEEIMAAEIAVEKATHDYRRGGSVEKVNAANSRLANAHSRLYEIDGGVVRDDR
jgi:hypothetical protein